MNLLKLNKLFSLRSHIKSHIRTEYIPCVHLEENKTELSSAHMCSLFRLSMLIGLVTFQPARKDADGKFGSEIFLSSQQSGSLTWQISPSNRSEIYRPFPTDALMSRPGQRSLVSPRLENFHCLQNKCIMSPWWQQWDGELMSVSQRRKKKKSGIHPLHVLTSAHHRYKWTIKLMEASGQSTCSANIFTKLSGSQLREIPLRRGTTLAHFKQLRRGTSKRACWRVAHN